MVKKSFLLLALCALCLACADAHAARRAALVIGNAAYKSSPLRNPVNDATDVADVLKSMGFTTILATDADKRAMIDGVNAFGRAAGDADIALFFYAGHGMQVNGINYLIPIGADVHSEDEVEFEAMQADRVLAKMEMSGARVNLVILDACRDNPFRSFRSSAHGLAVVRAVSGSVIVYATSPGDVAADGAGRNSPFTAHLLRHLADPGVTVKGVFDRVGAGVAGDSGGRQTPWVSSSLYQDVYLVGAPQDGGREPLPAESSQTAMASAPEPPRPGPRAARSWTEPATGMEFVWVPGGCFQMGSGGGDVDERPMHEVCVDGFWMGKYEVTNEQYRRYKAGHDSKDYKGISRNGGRQPAVLVYWEDAVAYARWLSGKGNGTFRLPTEAEWEYAARAGTATIRFWGDSADQACGFANVRDEFSARTFLDFSRAAHTCDDGYAVSAPAGSFKPNAFGLYDMAGNVWEWCQDWWNDRYYLQSPRDNPPGPAAGFSRVFRGGSWRSAPKSVRSANRGHLYPDYSADDIGFRLLRVE